MTRNHSFQTVPMYIMFNAR